MKTRSAFFVPAFLTAAFLAIPVGHAQGLRFNGVPEARRFTDGTVEWAASVSCAEPALLLGARVAFSLDTDLEGGGDTAGTPLAPSWLSPADCEGSTLPLRRGFSPGPPAVLRAELRTQMPATRAGVSVSVDSVTDVHTLLMGEPGSLLSLPRFCARPKNGEPDWIEVRNVSRVPVALGKVRLEGRALAGSLSPGASLTAFAAADTAEMRLWQPGAAAFPLSSWPGLRNTGDTLRLSLEVSARGGALASLVLDSVVYGPGASPREACASVPTEESGAGAHGFALEMAAGRWRRRAGPWTLAVTAPADGRYDLRAYDLDGLEVCALAHPAIGPRAFSLSTATCARLAASATAVLLQLQPRRAPAVRKLLWIVP